MQAGIKWSDTRGNEVNYQLCPVTDSSASQPDSSSGQQLLAWRMCHRLPSGKVQWRKANITDCGMALQRPQTQTLLNAAQVEWDCSYSGKCLHDLLQFFIFHGPLDLLIPSLSSSPVIAAICRQSCHIHVVSIISLASSATFFASPSTLLFFSCIFNLLLRFLFCFVL